MIFRSVVQDHIDHHNTALTAYCSSSTDFWQETEHLLLERCRGIFDDISSSVIRSELVHAGQLHCHDILIATKNLVQASIAKRLQCEIEQGNLCIAAIPMSVEDFAQVLESSAMGIALSNMEKNSAELISNIFRIFKTSVTK